MYLATQLISDKEKAKLQETFISMDENADGKLSRQELINGYSILGITSNDVEAEIDKIMNSVDVDHSGYIDYSEFIVAVMNKRKLLSEENLKKAFDVFDKDGSGSISTNEVKGILGVGKQVSENIWKDLIKEVDQNNDGSVSFDEFKNMMNKFTK